MFKFNPEVTEGHIFEHAVIGAGVSGMQMVLSLLKEDVKAKDIVWVDKEFNSGAFGSLLLDIAGNTAMGRYQVIFREMLAVFKDKFKISIDENEFAIFKENYDEMFKALEKENIKLNETKEDIMQKYPEIKDYCCSLSMVRPVLQRITDELQKMIVCATGTVKEVNSLEGDSLEIVSDTTEGYVASIIKTKKVMLALGAVPKTLKDLTGYNSEISMQELNPWTALSPSRLETWLIENRGQIKKIVIVGGWTHSGALIHKNIVQILEKLKTEDDSPIIVKLLMTGDPKFRYTDDYSGKVIHNNNGLDGDSARFVVDLVFSEKYFAQDKDEWKYKKIPNRVGFFDLKDKLGSYTVCAIGFKPPTDAPRVNEKSLDEFIRQYPEGDNGIFVTGFTHPHKDEEGAAIVGITKVWAVTQALAVKVTQATPSQHSSSSSSASFFKPEDQATIDSNVQGIEPSALGI